MTSSTCSYFLFCLILHLGIAKDSSVGFLETKNLKKFTTTLNIYAQLVLIFMNILNNTFWAVILAAIMNSELWVSLTNVHIEFLNPINIKVI